MTAHSSSIISLQLYKHYGSFPLLKTLHKCLPSSKMTFIPENYPTQPPLTINASVPTTTDPIALRTRSLRGKRSVRRMRRCGVTQERERRHRGVVRSGVQDVTGDQIDSSVGCTLESIQEVASDLKIPLFTKSTLIKQGSTIPQERRE